MSPLNQCICENESGIIRGRFDKTTETAHLPTDIKQIQVISSFSVLIVIKGTAPHDEHNE